MGTETTDADVVVAPTYVFPFPIPADLATTDETTLRALHAQVREHVAGIKAGTIDQAALAALKASAALARQIATDLQGRADLAAEVAQAFADVDDADLPDPAVDDDEDDDADDADDADPEADPVVEPAPVEPVPAAPAVTAAGRRPAPRVRDVAKGTRAPQTGPVETASTTMHAMADVPGFASGQQLNSFAEVAKAVDARLDQYGNMTAGRAGQGGYPKGQHPVSVYVENEGARQFVMTNYSRHNVVQFRTQYPENLRVDEGRQNGLTVAEFAASERRLPGGSLVASAAANVKAGRSLTAAAGWCAPSETIYTLLELETLDGLLDIPEIQATRGGFMIPTKGGPDFGSIYGVLGNGGTTHLSEAQVISGNSKVATSIPCPDFSEIRLGVDYYALTGGLLQRRGYPEMVARFSRGAVVALAHKINQGLITAIVAASVDAGPIPTDPSGDDAASALLAAVELAVSDAKYRHRMNFGTGTMEVVLPFWVLQVIRAALSRRTGVALLDVTNEQILSWFTMRGAVPRFVYDYQDQFSGLATGPGGPLPIRYLPTSVQMVVYPAGTWVKAVQDVISLDTIMDSTNLLTNQFMAVFTETGWAPMQMGPVSRKYTVPIDPSGVVGCCFSPQSS